MSKEKMPIEKKKVKTPKFRVSFPHVFEKHSGFKNQEPKYSITMLFDKRTSIEKLELAALNAAIEAWGDDKDSWPEGYRWPFRDGDKEPKKKGKPEFKNVIFVSASASKNRPQIVGNEIDPETGKLIYITKENGGEEMFYAGCYARAELLAFAYDTAGNVGISFSLQNLQKLGDGPQLSGRKNADQVFDLVEDGSNDASNYSTETSDEDDEAAGMGF